MNNPKGKRTMKSILSTLVVSTLLVACGQQNKEAATKTETVAISVATAQCDQCVSTITDALKAVDGVESTEIDLEKKVATVHFVPTKANLSTLESAIVNAGYDANDKKRNPEAYEKLPDCCK